MMATLADLAGYLFDSLPEEERGLSPADLGRRFIDMPTRSEHVAPDGLATSERGAIAKVLAPYRTSLDLTPNPHRGELSRETPSPTERIGDWARMAGENLWGADRYAQQRLAATAQGLASLFVLPALADTAFHSGRGDPANTLLAASGTVPGAAIASSIARKVAGAGSHGIGAAKGASLASGSPELYNPPQKPSRPFIADYPSQAPHDPTTRALTHDIEGRPLIAKYVVGRRSVGGADEALPPTQLDAFGEAITGRRPESVAASALPRGAVAAYDPNTGRIGIWSKVPPASRDMVAAHEISHGINDRAGKFRGGNLGKSIPVEPGQLNELKTIYNDLSNRQLAIARATDPNVDPAKVYWGTGFTPEDGYGYPARRAPAEYMAEAIRAYLADPNYIKTVAPNVAAAIRKAVNEHPALSRIIQFNSALGAAVGLDAPGAQQQDDW